MMPFPISTTPPERALRGAFRSGALLLTPLLALPLLLSGCGDRTDAKLDRAGESVREAADDIGDAAKALADDAADAAKKNAADAEDAAKQAADDAKKASKDAADDAKKAADDAADAAEKNADAAEENADETSKANKRSQEDAAIAAQRNDAANTAARNIEMTAQQKKDAEEMQKIREDYRVELRTKLDKLNAEFAAIETRAEARRNEVREALADAEKQAEVDRRKAEIEEQLKSVRESREELLAQMEKLDGAEDRKGLDEVKAGAEKAWGNVKSAFDGAVKSTKDWFDSK